MPKPLPFGSKRSSSSTDRRTSDGSATRRSQRERSESRWAVIMAMNPAVVSWPARSRACPVATSPARDIGRPSGSAPASRWLSRSSPGTARFASTSSLMYAAKSRWAASVWALVYRVVFRNVSDQPLKASRSLSGTPSMEQITRTGRGKARWVTRSAGLPCSRIRPMSSPASCSMPGRRADIRRAVNHRPTMRRHRSWPSSLSARAIGLAKMPSVSPAETRAASGRARPSRLSRGSESAVLTSS